MQRQLTAAEYVALGEISYRYKDTVTALRYFKRAIALDNLNLSAYYNRGDLYFIISKLQTSPDKKALYRKKTLSDLNHALSLDEKHLPSLNTLGALFLEEKKYHEAMAISEKALALKPDNYKSYCIYAGIFYQAPNLIKQVKGIPDFQTLLDKAIEYNNQDPVCYLNRGMEYFERGEKKLALHDFLSACQFNIKRRADVFECVKKNLSHYSKDDILSAICDFEEDKEIILLEQCIDKTTPLGQHLLKESWVSQSIKRAEEHLTNLKAQQKARLESNKNFHPAYAAKNSEAALAYCKSNPRDLMAYDALKEILFPNRIIHGNIFINAINAVIETNPLVATPYLIRARFYLTLEYNKACKDMFSAIKHLSSNENDTRKGITAFLDSQSKNQILTIINSFSDPKEKLYFLIECLDDDTLLGKRIWKQEGLMSCSLDKGHLLTILNLITNFIADPNLPLASESFAKTLGSINRLINKYSAHVRIPGILEYARGLINAYMKEYGFAIQDFMTALSHLPIDNPMNASINAFLNSLSKNDIIAAIETLPIEDCIPLFKKCFYSDNALGARILQPTNNIPCTLDNEPLNKILPKIKAVDPNFTPGMHQLGHFSHALSTREAKPQTLAQTPYETYEAFSNSSYLL